MSPTVRTAGEDIVGKVELAVPPERVYAALTDPAELARWWGGAEGCVKRALRIHEGRFT